LRSKIKLEHFVCSNKKNCLRCDDVFKTILTIFSGLTFLLKVLLHEKF
jgi:hypothetical protein